MEEIIKYFLQPQNGILGVIVIMLLGVVVWQQKRIDKKDQQITTLQDSRLQDSTKFNDGYMTVTREMVASQRDSVNALALMQRSVDSLATALQNWINNK